MSVTYSNALTPPADIEAERAVLGSFLLNSESIYTVQIRPEDFYLETHQWIMTAILKLVQGNECIDFLTVRGTLLDVHHLEAVGGDAYLTALITSVPSAVFVEAYAERVKTKAVARMLIAAAGEIAGLGYDSKGMNSSEMIARVSQIIGKVDVGLGSKNAVGIDEAGEEFKSRLLDYFENPKEVWGIPTGFDIDKYTGGLHKKQMTVISGDPAVGKTAHILDYALHAAKNDHPIAIFSLEMSREELLMRMTCNLSNTNAVLVKRGKLSTESQRKMLASLDQIRRLPIYIFDEIGTTDWVRARVAKLKRTKNVDVVIVDYSKLLADKGDSEAVRLGTIGKNIKQLAKDCDVATVLVHPVNRAAAQQSRRPVLSDLGWSWDIVYHADVLIYLWKNVNLPANDLSTEAIIAKNRHGPTLAVPMIFDPTYTRWANKA